MIVSRSGKVTYTKADQTGTLPSVWIRLAAGQKITDEQWPEIRNAIAQLGGVEGVYHVPGRLYSRIIVRLAPNRDRHTDAGMIADCRTVCAKANITIVEGPSEVPDPRR